MRWTALAAVALYPAFTTLVLACSDGPGRHIVRPAAPNDTSGATDTVVAQSKQLRRGERSILIRSKGVGRLIAMCDRRGRPAVSFVADRLLATASVTVQSAHHGAYRATVNPGERLRAPSPATAPDLQTWQVAEFAKVEGVTTIWVAMGDSAGRPFYACGLSAHAITTNEPP
jgi:hypothetical protein